MATQAEKNALASEIRALNDQLDAYVREIGYYDNYATSLRNASQSLINRYNAMVVEAPTPPPTPTTPTTTPTPPTTTPTPPTTTPTPLVCGFCGMQFSTVDALIEHLAVCPMNPSNQPTPTPTGDTGQIGGGEMAGEGAIGQEFPRDIYTAPQLYRYAFGIPQPGERGGLVNPWQQYLMGWQRPTQSLWELQTAMGQPGVYGTTTQRPEDYGAYAVGIQSNIHRRAQQLLHGLYGMTPEARSERGLEYGTPGYGMPTPFATSDVGIDYANLLQMALRPRLGRMGGAMMARRVPAEQEAWGRGMAESSGVGQGSFLNYLIDKYNLAGYF